MQGLFPSRSQTKLKIAFKNTVYSFKGISCAIMCIKLLIKMSLRRVAGGILEILLVTIHENRLRIYRLIGEKHALHVRAAFFFLCYFAGCRIRVCV